MKCKNGIHKTFNNTKMINVDSNAYTLNNNQYSLINVIYLPYINHIDNLVIHTTAYSKNGVIFSVMSFFIQKK